MRVIITPSAELDLAESRDWYESIRFGLAKDFEVAVDDAVRQIARFPQGYGLVDHGLRRALLQRFPHAVFYRQLQEAVQVVAVLHTSRDPRIWHSRSN